jgi:hypothetical protein
MDKAISKTIRGLMMLTAITAAIVSCKKEGRKNLKTDSVNNHIASNTGALTSATCGFIPYDLQVPEGNKLALQTYATGVQIYQVRRNVVDASIYEWVNIAPSATVYSKPNFTNATALHYKGPTWEFIKGIFKGDKVVAAKWKGVTVNSSAIPWLILKVVDSLSSPSNKVTYIQRICTNAGLPPATPASASNLGDVDSIPYTANYLFYIKD